MSAAPDDGRPAALRAELRRAFTPPYEAPTAVVVNGLLMSGAWFLLPTDSLFRVHSAWFFPLALASWMLADVPATNVLGSDPTRMSAALGRKSELRRRLTAKTLVLWLLVVPICVCVTIALARRDEPILAVLATMAALITIPFGTLAVAAWLGVLYPYHVIPLRVRWRNRRPYRRMIVRWLVLILMPYLYVPLIEGLLLLPVLAGWRLITGSWSPTTDNAFAAGALALALISVVAWLVGRAVTLRLVRRRTTELRSFLGDPSRG
jgi:hypothetical protein